MPNNKKRIKYEENPKKCKFCGGIISYEKRRNDFCTRSCAAAFCNKGIRRIGADPGNCLNCGNKLKSSKSKYCNQKCQGEFEWRKTCKLIEETQKFKNYSNNNIAKRYLLEKRGHKCEICGRTEWEGKKIPLVFDHIDGNSDNWDLSNCRLICRNCDGQLPTFSGRNVNKGRHTLRMIKKKERVSRGKSR